MRVVTLFNLRVFKQLNRTLVVTAFHMQIPQEKVHICLWETSVVTLLDVRTSTTYLDDVEH